MSSFTTINGRHVRTGNCINFRKKGISKDEFETDQNKKVGLSARYAKVEINKVVATGTTPSLDSPSS